MAKSRAIRLFLLATASMEKLYQLSLFRRIFEKESRVRVIEGTQLCSVDAYETAHI